METTTNGLTAPMHEMSDKLPKPMKKKRNFLSADDQIDMIADIRAGFEVKDIALKYDVSLNYVWKMRREKFGQSVHKVTASTAALSVLNEQCAAQRVEIAELKEKIGLLLSLISPEQLVKLALKGLESE